MARPLDSKARVKGYFKEYFTKFVAGSKFPDLSLDRAMDVLTLALAQNELDEMKAALNGKAQLPTSNFDISRNPRYTRLQDDMAIAKQTLEKLAHYEEGLSVDDTFDEPIAAAIARNCLIELESREIEGQQLFHSL